MTGLGDITMEQFVAMLCGDCSMLADGEGADEARARLSYEYASLADPASAARYLGDRAQRLKRRAAIQLMAMCRNLAEIGMAGAAKEMLAEYGYRSKAESLAQLKAEIDSMLKRAERDIAVEETPERAESQTPEQIRRGFDMQCASLMAHFKFQIDMGRMKASQFACLAGQAMREAKAMQAAAKKRK